MGIRNSANIKVVRNTKRSGESLTAAATAADPINYLQLDEAAIMPDSWRMPESPVIKQLHGLLNQIDQNEIKTLKAGLITGASPSSFRERKEYRLNEILFKKLENEGLFDKKNQKTKVDNPKYEYAAKILNDAWNMGSSKASEAGYVMPWGELEDDPDSNWGNSYAAGQFAMQQKMLEVLKDVPKKITVDAATYKPKKELLEWLQLSIDDTSEVMLPLSEMAKDSPQFGDINGIWSNRISYQPTRVRFAGTDFVKINANPTVEGIPGEETAYLVVDVAKNSFSAKKLKLDMSDKHIGTLLRKMKKNRLPEVVPFGYSPYRREVHLADGVGRVALKLSYSNWKTIQDNVKLGKYYYTRIGERDYLVGTDDKNNIKLLYGLDFHARINGTFSNRWRNMVGV